MQRVPKFYEAFQDARQVYIVMEHCVRGDLLDLLLREGQSWPEFRVCVQAAVPLLSVLQELHSLGIVHRHAAL